MKFKVRGLVFVGFAAAILSANAMADNENTVTSKSFTEATYQKKVGGGTNANKLVQATGTAGTVSYVEIGNDKTDVVADSEKVVTGNAVAAALAENGGQVNNSQMNITQNGVDAGHFNANQASASTVAIVAPSWDATSSEQGYIDAKPSIVNAGTSIGSADGTATKELPTTYAVKQYVDTKATADLSGKQDKTDATSGYKVGNSDGTWADMGSAVTAATGGYVSVTGGTDGAAVAINIDNNKIDTAVTSGSSNLVTSDAVADAIADAQTTNSNTYQPKSSATSVGVNGGTWKPLSATGYVAIDDTGNSVTVDIPASAINNSGTLASGLTDTTGTDLVTEYTLQQTLAAQPASDIPAQNPAICGATGYAPCALVAESDGFHWYTMATEGHAGGVNGDAQ